MIKMITIVINLLQTEISLTVYRLTVRFVEKKLLRRSRRHIIAMRTAHAQPLYTYTRYLYSYLYIPITVYYVYIQYCIILYYIYRSRGHFYLFSVVSVRPLFNIVHRCHRIVCVLFFFLFSVYCRRNENVTFVGKTSGSPGPPGSGTYTIYT